MSSNKPAVLITGGVGFIGVNAAARFIRRGWDVSIFDNLSRPGTRANLAWLKKQGRLSFTRGDLRSKSAVSRWVRALGTS